MAEYLHGFIIDVERLTHMNNKWLLFCILRLFLIGLLFCANNYFSIWMGSALFCFMAEKFGTCEVWNLALTRHLNDNKYLNWAELERRSEIPKKMDFLEQNHGLSTLVAWKFPTENK